MDDNGDATDSPDWMTIDEEGNVTVDAQVAQEPEFKEAVTGIYDLSTFGGDESQNTANCYIVNAPGTYKLPLVYGNAIKDGTDNTTTYTKAAEDVDGIKDFVNHLDNVISNPYIYNNDGCTPGGHHHRVAGPREHDNQC